MKKYLIIIAFLISLAVSATAYQPIIQERKVWEYINYSWDVGTGEKTYLFSRYGFTDVREKYGKEYHVWTLLDETTYRLPGYDTTDRELQKEEESWEIETVVQNRQIALLREEEGKVYMLLETPEIKEYKDNIHQVVSYTVTEGEEVVLYDFNIPVGEQFKMLYNSEILTEATVTDIGITKVGNKDVSNYSFSAAYVNSFLNPSETNMDTVFCVESIGVVSEGTLTDILTTTFIPRPSYTVDEQGFYALYDSAGNILYQNRSISKPTGINELEIQNCNQKLYDLFGREITRTLPGSVYIQNGKKFIGK